MSHSIRKLLLGGAAALATCPAFAGDVTPDRLVNADNSSTPTRSRKIG